MFVIYAIKDIGVEYSIIIGMIIEKYMPHTIRIGLSRFINLDLTA